MRRSQAGVTLVELAVGLAVVGILIATGLPTYTQWTQNMRVRAQAESILSGIQLARAEAIKRNTTVEFVLTGSAVDPSAANSLAPSASGVNWMVRQYRAASDDYAFIQGDTQEASGTYTTVTSSGGANAVTFNGFGRTTNNNDAVFATPITQIDIDSSLLGTADSRELRIQVSTGGGGARLCDPNAGSTDPRRC